MSARQHVVVVGDTLLDRDLEGRVERVSPDAPVPIVDVEREAVSPGGAGLTALLCTRHDADVTLVTPLAADAPAAQLRRLLAAAGVRVVALDQEGPTRQKTRVRAAGQSLLRLDRGGPALPVGELPPEATAAVHDADAVLVSCYGAGTSLQHTLREHLAQRARTRPVVWDPHPRGGAPVAGCSLVTPNLAEARGSAGMPGASGDEVARLLVRTWSARAVAVTAGDVGAWLATSAGEPLFVPATARAGDPCGAGDAFTAAAAVALAAGRTASEAVVSAVEAAGAFVASGGASGLRVTWPADRPPAPDRHPPSAGAPDGDAWADAEALVRRVRSSGGRVVATGGCFDVLHAGHVHSLEAARRLGDALVVLLNSDASVRQRKGEGRPVHTAPDRARVLRGLACVDAVVVFEEDDPREALQRLRPDVWAKGGDYEGAQLPEASVVGSWGGRVVLLPYVTGRSTSSILDKIGGLER